MLKLSRGCVPPDRVARIATWEGWCSSCGDERPLVLCETGPRGLRAWLQGLGADDRTLTLTCRLCGVAQLVPRREEDDPERPAAEEPVSAAATAVTAGHEPLSRPAAPEAARPEPARPDPTVDEPASTGAGLMGAEPAPAWSSPASAWDPPEHDDLADLLPGLVRARPAPQPLPPIPLPRPAAGPGLAPQQPATTDETAVLQLLSEGLDVLAR